MKSFKLNQIVQIHGQRCEIVSRRFYPVIEGIKRGPCYLVRPLKDTRMTWQGLLITTLCMHECLIFPDKP